MSDNSYNLQALVDTVHNFYRRGWVLGTGGNFSLVLDRDPLRVAITASGVDKGLLRTEQLLHIDEREQVLTGVGKPSAETGIHLAIVTTTGAGAVCHTHSTWGTLLSNMHMAAGGFAIEGYEMLKGLQGVKTHEHREWIPILDNSQDIPKLSQEVIGLLKNAPEIHGFLLRGHGLYTWGADLFEAKRQIEILEFLFETVGRLQLSTSA